MLIIMSIVNEFLKQMLGHQIGRVLMNSLISFLAIPMDDAFVTESGARFHSLMASFAHL